jgi:glycosyltransferase involved in cell wall biosynthesis
LATLHEFHMPEFGSWWKNLLWKPWYKWLDTVFLRSMDYLLVTVPNRRAAAEAILPGRVAVLPAGSNIPRLEITAEEKTEVRRRWLGGGRVLLGSFGVFHPDKNYQDLLPVLARHSDWVWICAGGEPNAYFREIQRLVRRAGLGPQVQFIFFQEAREMSRLLQSLDIFVMTDIRGLSGRKCSGLSALANGCAVVTRQGADTEPEFKQGENVWFYTNDLEAKIGQAVTDPELRSRMGRGARELSGSYFSWERIGQEHRFLYEKLVTGQNQSREVP